ncbi:MAG: cell division protein SepF [Arcanobacterium sp.]|nr:cell division protein SepF [Arcanobacterium sp.]
MGFLDRITQKSEGFEDEYEFLDEVYEDEEGEYAEEGNISPMHALTSSDIVRIVTMWVSSYREIKDFAVEFRSGTPVILNLSQAADGERARIVDFALGLCFGLEGAFSRISDDVFLLTPNSVKLDSRGGVEEHDFAR